MTNQPAISCRGIHKDFGGKPVLNGVDLELPRSEIVVLSGENGVGKTTLARILAGLEEPTEGEVDFAPEASRLYVPQDFVIWPHLSVKSNLGVSFRGERSQRNERISYLLGKIGLAGTEKQRAGRLSFGQQHRLAIARALIFNPDVLLLDEPLAHADPEGRSEIVEFICSVIENEKIATLWITHGEEFGDDVRKVKLEDGRLNQQS